MSLLALAKNDDVVIGSDVSSSVDINVGGAVEVDHYQPLTQVLLLLGTDFTLYLLLYLSRTFLYRNLDYAFSKSTGEIEYHLFQ